MDNNIELNFNTIVDGHHKTTYRGVTMVKDPFDYVMYQMIINEIKPDLIIEVGTNYGGTTLYMADLLNIIGNGVVHTIDVVDYVQSDLINNHHRIKRFYDGFQSYDINLTKEFNKILLIEDGSHQYADVINTMNMFKDIIPVDSYMIIEDGSLNWMGWEEIYNGGPLKAIEEFLSENDDFIIDRKWCDFYGKNVTFNPNGFLKKIR
jgi:cephalosporin hydroxylase